MWGLLDLGESLAPHHIAHVTRSGDMAEACSDVLAEIPPFTLTASMMDELKDTGGWTSEELESMTAEQLKAIALWVAAWNIKERD